MAMPRIRVHIENTRAKHELFHVTRERWDAACARHRPLARWLAASIGWDGDILGDAVGESEIMIGVPERRKRLAERAPRLRWLHATSAGVDAYLPLDWLPRGVDFTNNRGAHGIKAEQYMHMAYVMLNTRMAEIIADRSARRWRPVFSPSIIGRTALVVGVGDLGQAAARAAAKLGMNVIGVSRTGRKVAHADAVHRITALDRLLELAPTPRPEREQEVSARIIAFAQGRGPSSAARPTGAQSQLPARKPATATRSPRGPNTRGRSGMQRASARPGPAPENLVARETY